MKYILIISFFSGLLTAMEQENHDKMMVLANAALSSLEDMQVTDASVQNRVVKNNYNMPAVVPMFALAKSYMFHENISTLGSINNWRHAYEQTRPVTFKQGPSGNHYVASKPNNRVNLQRSSIHDKPVAKKNTSKKTNLLSQAAFTVEEMKPIVKELIQSKPYRIIKFASGLFPFEAECQHCGTLLYAYNKRRVEDTVELHSSLNHKKNN